ncbi:MAG: methyltransferase domain-containing protein [bacterium]
MHEFEKTTKESYDKTADVHVKKICGLRPMKPFKNFISRLKKDSLVLDLGCGPGLDAEMFAREGFGVIGVDFSEKMIGLAKGRVDSAEFKVMNVKKLDFEDESFDAVWANAILLHIFKKDISLVLNEVFRVLKKGGVLYVSVKEGDEEILKPDARYGGVKKFWSFFQKDEIEGELKKAGFKILESYIEKLEDSYATNPWVQVFCGK